MNRAIVLCLMGDTRDDSRSASRTSVLSGRGGTQDVQDRRSTHRPPPADSTITCRTPSPRFRQSRYWDAGQTFTSPFNLTGHPVVVLPLARSAEGLPIGVQLVGRWWGEVDLLAVARRI